MRVHRFLVLATGVLSTPIAWDEKRGLLELLDGQVAPATEIPAGNNAPTLAGIFDTATSILSQAGATTITAHHQHTNTAGETVSSSATSLHTAATTASSTSATLLPQHTDNPKAGHGRNADASASGRPTPSITSVSATNNDISSTPPGELAQWKVIGISIICVTFVAIIIIAVTFFDTWTAFLRDVVGCGGCRKGRNKEKDEPRLVPDWNRRTWEFKLANEDGHRYPTMASMDSMGKARSLTESPSAGNYGFHAEQALGRKPSTR